MHTTMILFRFYKRTSRRETERKRWKKRESAHIHPFAYSGYMYSSAYINVFEKKRKQSVRLLFEHSSLISRLHTFCCFWIEQRDIWFCCCSLFEQKKKYCKNGGALLRYQIMQISQQCKSHSWKRQIDKFGQHNNNNKTSQCLCPTDRIVANITIMMMCVHYLYASFIAWYVFALTSMMFEQKICIEQPLSVFLFCSLFLFLFLCRTFCVL